MKLNSVLGVLVFILGISHSAHAGHITYGGGGASPFSTSNTKAELADQEFYQLFGTIVVGPTEGDAGSQTAYFKVDLSKQPWLANAHRQENPYYPIIGDPTYWEKFNNASVRLASQAFGKVVVIDGQPAYVIFLKPYLDKSEVIHR